MHLVENTVFREGLISYLMLLVKQTYVPNIHKIDCEVNYDVKTCYTGCLKNIYTHFDWLYLIE